MRLPGTQIMDVSVPFRPPPVELSCPPGHRAYTVGRTEELMGPPGGTHTTIDLYSKLSADPTIFAKPRIKSEKADA